MRADSTPPVAELKFNDPDNVIVQIQDTSYCGGSGGTGLEANARSVAQAGVVRLRSTGLLLRASLADECVRTDVSSDRSP